MGSLRFRERFKLAPGAKLTTFKEQTVMAIVVGAVGAVAIACAQAPTTPQATSTTATTTTALPTPQATSTTATTTTALPLWSQLAHVSFPPGSTVDADHPGDPQPSMPSGLLTPPPLKPGEGIEVWKVPRPIPDQVADMRRQLPIYATYDGLPWCVEDVVNTKDGSMQWAWGDDHQILQVVVMAPWGKTGRGGPTSDVHISRHVDTSCQDYLNNQ
jgi:hypothetical protein